MDKIKTPDGVEYTSDNGHNERRHDGVWASGIASAIGGGVVGYLIGDRFGKGGSSKGNGECSDNQCVNRYELNQAKETEQLRAELAKEKAERYADGIGISTYEKMVSYVEKQFERRDNVIADVTKAVATQDKESAVTAEKLNCLRDRIGDAFDAIGATRASISAIASEVKEWADCRFLRQPKVVVCPGDPSLQGVGCPSTTTTTGA